MSAALFGFDAGDIDDALTRVPGSIAKLDGTRIFVTGGTGFIGRWLLALFARAAVDIDVVALTRDSAAFRARHPETAGLPWLSFVEGDARSFTYPGGAFSHVIHAAADTSVEADNKPMELAATIVDGARRTLDFAARAGARRFLYLSSGAVYGRQPADMERVPEDFAGAPDPLDPRAVYGNSKRAAEMLCAAAARAENLDCVVARVFAVVGPGLPLDAHFAIGNFIRDALASRDIVVSGDGSPLRSYIYAGDLAAWLVALLVGGRANTAYNVGSDEPVSISGLAAIVQGALDSPGLVRTLGKPAPGAPRARYIPSIDRARRDLGLDIWTPLDEAIRRAAAHAARSTSAAPTRDAA